MLYDSITLVLLYKCHANYCDCSLLVSFIVLQVTLQGNPLAYHPKHRVKTAKHLSNLINRNTVRLMCCDVMYDCFRLRFFFFLQFRLDGKKLSAAEKKVNYYFFCTMHALFLKIYAQTYMCSIIMVLLLGKLISCYENVTVYTYSGVPEAYKIL